MLIYQYYVKYIHMAETSVHLFWTCRLFHGLLHLLSANKTSRNTRREVEYVGWKSDQCIHLVVKVTICQHIYRLGTPIFTWLVSSSRIQT